MLKRISDLEKTLAETRMRIPCSRQERKNIKTRGKAKVIAIIGDPESLAYQNGYRVAFRVLWSDFKGAFQLKSVDETKEHQYIPAIHWIDEWQPPAQLKGPGPAFCYLCGNNPGEIKADDVLICNDCSEFFF